MSILINMEMPISCDNCWALDDYGDYPRCRITEEQRGYNFQTREKHMDNCPLIPIQPHGRLIDADALASPWNWLDDDGYPREQIIDRVNAAPTIIEAEGVDK